MADLVSAPHPSRNGCASRADKSGNFDELLQPSRPSTRTGTRRHPWKESLADQNAKGSLECIGQTNFPKSDCSFGSESLPLCLVSFWFPFQGTKRVYHTLSLPLRRLLPKRGGAWERCHRLICGQCLERL